MVRDKRWEVMHTGLVKEENIVDALLENRGIKTSKEKDLFLHPKNSEEITLKELEIDEKQVKLALKRIKKALLKKEEVIVYGDYDADGVTATGILWEALFNLGLKVMPYIPERFSEGYGLNIESMKSLKEKNPNIKLIITVDHGIVAGEKINFAKDLGVDVIITDHHQPGKTKPKPLSLIHTTKIGGAGVAWVLAREVTKDLGTKKDLEKVYDLLELVAIGTLADQIPLLGSNRSFVKDGLEKLNKTRRPGLIALFESSRVKIGSVGPYEVGFIIAPRINAMGRLEHAMESLRLICTRKSEKAQELAATLNRVNLERQKIVEQVVTHARKSSQKFSNSKVIVIADISYHEGVIGLAASRLVEEFYKPTIIISKKGEVGKASGRSISGFNIIEAIRKASEFYIEGGGHPMAAGFSIKIDQIEAFTKKFREISEPLLTDEILTRVLKIDLELPLSAVNKKLFDEIATFEPAGLGNSTPTFLTKDVNVLSTRLLGADRRHLKLKLEKDGVEISGLAFGKGELYKNITTDKPIDIAYSLMENTWNGSTSLELRIKDLKL